MKKGNGKAMAKAEAWEKELIAMEEKRQAASAEALLKAQAASASAMEEKKSAQAARALQSASAEAQEEAGIAFERELEKRQRKNDRIKNSGKNSAFGHRSGSEGAQMDHALAEYSKAYPDKPYPNAYALMIFAKEKGIALPYSEKRIRGHLNHLKAAHRDLLPPRWIFPSYGN